MICSLIQIPCEMVNLPLTNRISTDDWIGKMKLNKGRVYEDEYWIEVDDVKDQASVSTGQVATEQVATEQVATGIDISEGSVDC